MESNQTVNLYVTHVEKEGPFLKIWGQTEKNNAIYVEQFLAGASQHFDMGVGKVAPETLQPGTLVCAKYKDNKYYRARIMNMCIQDTFVEVSFVDFGNKDIVDSGNIRSLQNFPSSFISIPSLAIGFIFAEAHCVGGGDWDERVFEVISKEIKYREVQCQLLIQATQYFLVKIFIDGADLCAILIQRALMQPITLQAQQAVLLSMSMQKQMIHLVAPPAQTPTATINTYKACTLEPGCQYQVYVSYVNDGPCQFSVQLKQTEDVLAKLMSDINSGTLKLLEDLPIPGTICLAKCQEDDSVCRAVVTNEVDNNFKVFYVDFGNYEVVPIDALYQIPFKYVLPKVMAIRFALAGVEKSTLTMEMRVAFKNFVDNRMLHMKVLPTPTRMAIPKCELFDPESKISALDIVNRAAEHAYPDPISLTRGFSQLVKVSFVYSCSRFYVQLSGKETELTNLMTDLQETCQMYEPIDPNVIKVGLPCCALFEGDQLWYRSQVVNVSSGKVKVRYIDYGNEEELDSSQLKGIEGEQLTILRPQAIECCLNGYQNMEDDAERDALLEEIVLEGTFTMKVVEMVDKKALVDLYDSSNYNVASLLLDKIAAAKSQASPMLVQAGNKIEHRKSHSPKEWPKEQNFRADRERNPVRETNSWERSNDGGDKPWRQNNRESRNFENSNNDNERGSWRQNNKGFSPNNQRTDNRENSQKRDGWNNTANNNSEWGDSEASKPVADEEWNKTNSNTVVKDDWNTPANDTGYRNDKRQNDYGRNKGGFDRDNRGDGRGDRYGGNQRDGGYRKKPDFKGDGSDSGSEKGGFHKGPRTSSRNDRGGHNRYEKNFDHHKPRHSSFDDKSAGEDSWNVSAVTAPIDAAPAAAAYAPCEVVGTEAKVTVSWFHNPGLFHCQVVDFQDQFKTMMEEIQQFYKNRKPETSVAGAPVIGLFPEDNVLYRAQVLQVLGAHYKVYFVDFGNVSTVSKVWPIDKKFMTMPAQATACGLHGVAGVQADWGDVDAYGVYFDKESFLCRFIAKEDGKTLVNIFYESEDVAQQLVRDGLAVSTQIALPEIEIPILVGQQLRARLMSVNNLADIIIVLECGLAVSCAAHNLETATETFENTLKALLEQTVIVYVDNVIDDKLEVTFYDTEGNKHVILNPDEGAFEVVERLCPMPVLRSTVTGYVSFADADSVFVQSAEYAELLAYLLDQLFETYEGQAKGETTESPIVPEEGQIYAIHSEDGNWYRGKVTSFDDAQAAVCYVDYGNSESVAFSEIRELDAKFLDYCTMSLQIIVPEAESFLDKDVTATIAYGENGWEGALVILETTAVESDKLQEESGDTGFATSSLEKPESELMPTESDESNTRLEEVQEVAEDGLQTSPPIRGQPVFASHVDSPNEFYLQFAESLNAIEELQAELQAQAPEMPVLENPATGMMCAAPYSVDQQWYRAEILDADADITTVRFVDFGNTDVIENGKTPIRTLSSKLLSLALYATRCSLKVKPKDEEWNTVTLEVFEKLVLVDNLSAEFLDQDEKTSYVELYSEGVDVRAGLLQQNLALPMEEVAGGAPKANTGFVSHLNSPSEFWVQLENCVDELEWIAEQLSAAESFAELQDLTPGTLCAALFPDDQMWYRARILSNTVAGIELLFIDYGNSSTSSSLRQLPEDLVATAALAQKCCLQRPEGMPAWTPEACAKFAEISLEGQTIFEVKKIATDETSTVQLWLNGQDVATMLLPETEDGYVKEAETLQGLRLAKAGGEAVEGEFALEALPGQELGEEAKEKFEELNEQGATLFQIEFVNENTIRLYLNGQDIRPQLASFENSQTENDTLIEDTGAKDSQETEMPTSEIDVTVQPNVITNIHEDADKKTVDIVPEVREVIHDLQSELFIRIDKDNEEDTPLTNHLSPTIGEDANQEISHGEVNVLKQIEPEDSAETAVASEDSEQLHMPLEQNPECDDKQFALLNPEDVSHKESSEIDQKPELLQETAVVSQDAEQSPVEQEVVVMSSEAAVTLDINNEEITTYDNPECDENPTVSQKSEDLTLASEAESSKIELEPEHLEESECRVQLQDVEETVTVREPSQIELKPDHVNENVVDLQDTSLSHGDISQKENSSADSVLPMTAAEDVPLSSYKESSPVDPEDSITKILETSHSDDIEQSEVFDQTTEFFVDNNTSAEVLEIEEAGSLLEDSKTLEKSKIVDQEKELCQRNESLSPKVSPKTSPARKTSSSPSKVPSPMKKIEKTSPSMVSPKRVSPVKVSPKKESPVKILPSSPVKISPSSPVKVSPKKDLTNKVSTKKESPSKVSPKRQSPVKTSPVKESKTLQVTSPTKKTKNNVLLESVQKMSLSKETSPVTEVAEEKETVTSRSSSRLSSAFSHDEKIVPACLSRPETPNDDNLELEASVQKMSLSKEASPVTEVAEEKETVTSRSSSRLSSAFSHDEKIVPACLSRPETPNDDNLEIEAILKSEEKKEVGNRPQSSCFERLKFDEKIVPACISRPETPNEDNSEVEAIMKTVLKKFEDRSRPQSACSGRFSFDEKIVPACISRPTSAVDDELEVETTSKSVDNEQENEVLTRPVSASSKKIQHDEKIVSAALSRPYGSDDEDADIGDIR